MSKTGQARVLTPGQFAHLLNVIQEHRYPGKNTALVQISFKLGLRVQEIALLQIKDVAELGPEISGERSFKLQEILALPAAYTKGADALKRSQSTYQRRRISFSVHDFERLVHQIETMAKAGVEVNPEVKKHRCKSRDLPMSDPALREALENYIALRLADTVDLRRTAPLFFTQKGGPYSPNTLQEHLALMQCNWAGVERASSHSGRRTLITNIIHSQKKSVKIAQKIARPVSGAWIPQRGSQFDRLYKILPRLIYLYS